MPDDWLPLILAVANSTFIVRYYDIAFHNKLYAGRRRFQTQFVKEFPLPSPDTPESKRIVTCVRTLLSGRKNLNALEEEIDRLVWQAFGLVKEPSG
jgi:hypothetical protein